MATEKLYYSWQQFDKDIKKIARRIKRTNKRFDGIFGPPRGGLPVAVALSHQLNLPLFLKPKSKRTLIVDDISDTGKTLKPYAKNYFIATIFYRKQSAVSPAIWIRKKTNKWIVFPWEKS